MSKIASLLLIVGLTSWIARAAPAEAPAPQEVRSTAEIDVTPLISQLEPPDPLPALGIRPYTRAPQGPTREDRLNAAAHWMSMAARKPVMIQIPDTGMTLNVTGDPQTLQQLKDAIKQINPPGAAQVQFDCRLFTLSPDVIRKLDGTLRTKVISAMAPGSIHAEPITENERDALKKAVPEAITAPRLLLEDGRSGWFLMATERTYIANFNKHPAQAPATQPTSTPELAIVSHGVAVGAKVDVNPQDKTVAVQVKTELTKLLEMKYSLADPNDPQTRIQVPTLETFKFEQLCSVADGQSLLCHGERELVNGPTTRPTSDDVFFVITCRITGPAK